MEDFLRSHKTQHRVPQEFQLLIIRDPIRDAIGCPSRFHLTRLRTMRKRLLQQFGVREAMAQHIFQRGNFT